MKPKYYISLILVLVIILVFIIGLIVIYNKQPAILSLFRRGTLPNETLCEFTETGWACVHTMEKLGYKEEAGSVEESEDILKYYQELREVREKFLEETNALYSQFEQSCEDQGGRWRTPSCDFRYSDAGKKCTSSKECKGNCVIDTDYVIEHYPNITILYQESINCTDRCKGVCSEYPLDWCVEWWYEVDNGKLEPYAAFCD